MAALNKEDYEQLASLFVGQMTPLLQERDAEIKKSINGEFDTAIQRHIDALNTRMNEIETKGKRPVSSLVTGVDGKTGIEAEEDKLAKRAAFKSFLQHGLLHMPKGQRDLLLPTRASEEDVQALQTKAMELRQQEEFKAFGIADDTLGGYFVLPEIMQNEIVKTSVLYTPARDLARVQQTANNSVEIRYRKTTLSAQWVSETGTRTESLGQTYGKKSIPTHEMYAYVIFSRQQLDDEYFDLEADVQNDIAEQFGVTEGAGFVNGSGVGQMQGFLPNVATNVQTAAGASAITYTDVVKVFHKLKPAYRNSPNCKWVFNQNTLSALRQLTDTTNGRPIFQSLSDSGLAGANPPTILGKPYVEATDMPDIATGNRTMAVGDFTKGYRFVDRIQMTSLRLQELLALSGQVGLMVYKRVGGEIVLDEALAVLKQA